MRDGRRRTRKIEILSLWPVERLSFAIIQSLTEQFPGKTSGIKTGFRTLIALDMTGVRADNFFMFCKSEASQLCYFAHYLSFLHQ